jgi:hypothetical protein
LQNTASVFLRVATAFAFLSVKYTESGSPIHWG